MSARKPFGFGDETTIGWMSRPEFPVMQRARTIFSLSTAPGKAGVAVIRISGPAAFVAGEALAGQLPSPRVAGLRRLRDPETGVELDKALVLQFSTGGSFTGEESVEFQVHGGRAIIRSILEALGRVPGLRVAEPGEFTRRAFENGKLDLTQVEALGDLIDAETEQQRRQALAGMSGLLGARVTAWRELLLEAKAIVAAEIDFSDEGDVGEDAASGIDSLLERLERSLSEVLGTADQGRIVQEGFRIALIGAPNVGKSTLLNSLAKSEVAIVTEHAGTTRDVIEVQLDIGGFAVILQDTAGLREAVDPVERIGIERSRKAAKNADLVLLLDDGALGFSEGFDLGSARSIRVRTKRDLGSSHISLADLAISAMSGEGIDSLMERIREELESRAMNEPSLVTRQRHRACIETGLRAIRSGRADIKRGIEFVDDDLRVADRALAELVGELHVEDVLGAIFSRFCVGK